MSNTPEQQVQVGDSEFKGYGFIICGETGMPKVDDPTSVPDFDWGTLTQEEKDHINAKAPEHLRRSD